ncbi:E3 ubiquitin-protein ligase siah2 [Orobanche hederae]
MAEICMVEDEEEEGPVIYRRRSLSVQPVRSWIVTDDELIHTNSASNAENRMFLIDPDVLDCPICLYPLFTPVFECENSHIACSSCCAKLKRKCPFCCMPIGINDNRCRGLEKFIESISRISCKNVKYGCKKTMPYSEKSRHEQMCPHATCNCPHPSCSFSGSYKNLYLHFHIQHEPSTTRFTCKNTFSLGVEINQKRMFLQEQHKNVIFILNHEVKEDGRAFSIDYLGPATSKSCFVYQLTAKRMKTSLSLQSEPGIYTEWSMDTQKMHYLTIPSDFEGYGGLLSLSICIKECISSEFEVDAEEIEEVFENEDNGNANGALQVVMTDPDVLDCSICHEPLCTPIFQWFGEFASYLMEDSFTIKLWWKHNNSYPSYSCIHLEIHRIELRKPLPNSQEQPGNFPRALRKDLFSFPRIQVSDDKQVRANINQVKTTSQIPQGIHTSPDWIHIPCSGIFTMIACAHSWLIFSTSSSAIVIFGIDISLSSRFGQLDFLNSSFSFAGNLKSSLFSLLANLEAHEEPAEKTRFSGGNIVSRAGRRFLGRSVSSKFAGGSGGSGSGGFGVSGSFSVITCQNGHLACCLCCSKVETICPICYPLGYIYNRCRGLEVAIESIGRILCIHETLAAYSNKKSEHEQMCHPHSSQKDDDELIPIEDVESDLLMSEEEEDEDELELMGKNQQQHMTCSLPTTNNESGTLPVVLYPNVLDCMICSNLLSPPVFQCEMGHVACSSCCCELKGICLCCMPIGINNNRCRGLEKFIESISSISCKNAVSGCTKTVPYNNKRKHELSCPHATCFCPHPSCSFAGSFKSLYIHFGIKHTASTTRFTYDTTFSICIEIDRKHIFLQEQNENVIFILNHEVQEHGRAFNIDCVGVGCYKSGFVYQLTAKSMETCLLLRSVPEIYTTWSKDTPRKYNLTVPSGFADYDGLLSLSVCIKKKVISSEFEKEMEKVRIEFIPNLDGSLKVMLTNLDMFYCSTCFKPLCSPVIQCEKGHLSCSSCCSKMKKICPLCYTSTGCYSYNHCKGLENIIGTAIIPCKNAKRGCKMRMRLRYHSYHEQLCPHATCFCPYPSCPFTGSHENLYLHFGIKHEADITRFTYGTTFSLCVDINQEHLFLQEKHSSVIFILDHQVREHERVIYIDCVGTKILRYKFEYQLTAKSMETYRALECVPQICKVA